jgi:hypothetical protein
LTTTAKANNLGIKKEMPKLLSLFDGTGAICQPFREAGWEVSSLDVDGRFGATIQEDILQWDYAQEAVPDVIVSGTPCEQYSTARTRGGPRNYALADRLASKQWEIIKYFLDKQPALLYFIENPAFSHLWKRPCASEFANPHVICDFCCYGSPYRKRTRWATNSSWAPRPLCNPKICVGCPNGKSHARTAQKGPSRGTDSTDRFSTDQLHAYPEPLCQEIFEHCQRLQWEMV